MSQIQEERERQFLQNIIQDYDLNLESSIEYLFFKDFVNDEYSRYDFIIDILMIESKGDNEDISQIFYEKEKNKYGLVLPSFDLVMSRFSKELEKLESIDRIEPILVNENINVLSETLLFPYLLKNDYVKSQIYLNKDKLGTFIKRDKKWLHSLYNENQINLIEECLLKIVEKFKKKFISIIWSPAFKYSDRIISEFSKKYSITNIFDLDFKNDVIFRSFVDDIYEIDDIDRWKIDVKYNLMKSYIPKCKVFEFEFYNAAYKKKLVNGYIEPFSDPTTTLKKIVRESLSLLIDDYFYDISFHVSDNVEEARNIRDIIVNRYNNYIE